MSDTQRTDLTDQFRAGRFAQIERLTDRTEALEAAVASGEARKLPDGSYKILKGWDKGEILTANGLPLTGLDVNANGETAFMASRVRPWHANGTFLEEGLFSTGAALMAAHCDWEIKKVRSRFVFDDDAEISESNPVIMGEDDQFQVMRTDTRTSLGQVGRLWTTIQNKDAFKFMEEFGEPFETIGSFRGGRRVFASMRLPHTMTVDVSGVNEIIQMYIVAINHHDGNGGLKLYVTPYRIECMNLERMAVNGAVTSWTVKHTPGYENALAEAQKSLRLVDRYAAAWSRDENKLAQRDVKDTEIADVIADIWDMDEDDKAQKQKNAAARVMDIMDRWAVEQDRCGKTAYALERAITGHVDHAADRRPRGEQKTLSPLALEGLAALEDTGTKLKSKAHERMMLLVTR